MVAAFLYSRICVLSDPVSRAITKKNEGTRREMPSFFSYLSGGSPAYSLAKSEKFSMI